MKTKVIPAYEPVSSNTIRLTAKEIAKLLSKCDLLTLRQVMKEYINLSEMYQPDIVFKARKVIIQESLED